MQEFKKNESETLRIFRNLEDFGILKKMNPKSYEFSKTWCTGILKNESKTLRIFDNLVYRKFKKMNSKLYEFSKTLVWEFLKNESKIFSNF